PGTRLKAASSFAAAWWSDCRSTTTGIGSVKPGPKPADSRSYACRVVWLLGAVPASARPRRAFTTGEATTSRTATATGRTYLARPDTNRPHAAIGVFA